MEQACAAVVDRWLAAAIGTCRLVSLFLFLVDASQEFVSIHAYRISVAVECALLQKAGLTLC